MSILLTKDEMDYLWDAFGYEEAICKSQLKKVLRGIEEYKGSYIDRRFWKSRFWQVLLKEME